jgi:predicted MPP superfamily phosphohydrolase
MAPKELWNSPKHETCRVSFTAMRQWFVLILHISDIHLREGVVGSSQDPDAHLRGALVTDAANFCQQLGKKPGIIAISGDIAFAGSEPEYKFAAEWIEDLCKRCGSTLKEVFVIPGNHDVVRSTTKQTLVQLLHKEIRNASSLSVDSVISGFLKDGLTGPLLYKSIEPYNEFAGKFLCSLFPPDRTICERRAPFQKGWTVRFLGVNSTFVSGENDRERGLYVDVAAKQISTEPGAVNIVLCHHPYSWLANGEIFSDHLATVSQLQLFGHVHTNRIELHRDFVRVAASAAHPDRQELGWEPGYNLIELDLSGTQESPRLRVRVHVRVWQERPGQFRAKQDRNRSEIFEQEIMLEPWAGGGDTPAEATGETAATQPQIGNPSEDIMDSLRNVSIRFFGLTASQRAMLAGKLNLVEEQDKDLPEFERTRKILLRAKDKELLARLASEMEEVTR